MLLIKAKAQERAEKSEMDLAHGTKSCVFRQGDVQGTLAYPTDTKLHKEREKNF